MSVVPLLKAVSDPCRRCGHPRDASSPSRGRYARLCQDCRSQTARERQRDGQSHMMARSSVELPKIVQAAVPSARRFQRAIEQRHTARMETQAALGELNSALRAIQEAARGLMNQHQSTARIDRELEEETQP